MIHPDTYVLDTPKGLGVFAKRKFHFGEILWISDIYDTRISLDEYNQMHPLMQRKFQRYSYMDSDYTVVMPWDEGKYVNHSCSPNSTSILQYDNISVAIKDIEQDAEIVEDYYSYFAHFETFTCKCGSQSCRHNIEQQNTYDPTLRIDFYDVAADIFKYDQPLLEIDSEENRYFLSMLAHFRMGR